jgi:DNA polymerase-3 subunit alpha
VHGRAKRAAVVATIEQAMSAAQKAARDKASGQVALFGFGGEESSAGASAPAEVALASAQAWSESETLTSEKDVLGFYVSSHPLEEWQGWIQGFMAAPVADVPNKQAKERVLLGGLVNSVRTIVVKNGRSAGQKMAVLSVEDRTGTIEAVLFSDQYLKYGHLAQADTKVWIIGEVDLARGTPQVVVDRVLPIEAPPRDPVQGLDLLIDAQRFNGESLDRLERAAEIVSRAVLAPPDASAAAWTGRPAPVRVFVRLEGGGNAVPVRTGEGWAVRPTARLMRELLSTLGEGNVRLSGPLLPRDREERREKWADRPKAGAGSRE